MTYQVPFVQAIRPVKGMPLIKWLLRLQNRWWVQLLNLPLFYLLFLPLLGGLGAVNMLVGMFLHELGHYLLFRRYAIKAIILGLWPLGAVASPVDDAEDKRCDQLSWWNIGWLLLAGPAANVLLMVVGVGLQRFSPGWPADFGARMVEINGFLAVMNLVPIWNLDAGQLFHVFYSSLKEAHDIILALSGTLISVAILVLIAISPLAQSWWIVAGRLLLKGWWLFFVILLAVGCWHKQGKDNPLHCESAQAMTVRQVVIQLGAYFALVLSALTMLNGSPTFF